MKTYGLVGRSLSHSFSKKIFTDKFRLENLSDFRYELFEINKIQDLRPLIEKNPDILGLNITIPFKKEIITQLDGMDETASGAGAINTLQICRKNEKIKLYGFNTDVIGFRKSIRPFLSRDHDKALILGNGGAGNAVKKGLSDLGISFKTVERISTNPEHLIFPQLTKEIIEHFPMIINTTPLGMYPDIDTFPLIPYQYISSNHFLMDLVYNPSETIFLKNGRAKGATCLNGLSMLYFQAEESFRIWRS